MFTKSGGSRNYFRTAIRRTEIHSVVKQSLLSFSFSLYLSISLVLSFSLLPSESFGGTNERKRGSARERGPSLHAVSTVIDLSPPPSRRPPPPPPLFVLLSPLISFTVAFPTSVLHRQTFSSTGKRRDRVSLHFAKP